MSFHQARARAALLALAASLTPAAAQQAVAPAIPTIVGAFSKPGVTPEAAICGGFGAGSRAAIGPSSLLQVVNCKTALIDRTTGAILASTSLSSFTGVVGANTDPQMIWDPSTQRFYYAASTAAVVNGLPAYSIAFGFSKTAAPANLSTDWCRYSYDLGRDRPNFTRLGDSAYFMIVGYSLVTASPAAVTGAILAISKPPAGTTCPLRSSFKTAVRTNLVDQAGAPLQRPTPANQIDNYPTGYVGAINASNAIAFYPVTRRLLDGAPVINNPRYLALTAFASPPLASQPGSAPKLFSERAPAQAVQAMDPRLGKFAFWIAHTVADPTGALSRVRWYEVDPTPAAPVMLRQGDVGAAGISFFNGAISPDRRVDGATSLFGDSFVLQLNQSSATIYPRIVAYSSVAGGALSAIGIKSSVGPYFDVSCPDASGICLWGGASAAPDPRSPAGAKNVVWGTSQYSGVLSPPTTGLNYRTWNFAIKP